ncbi:hypothetical protein D9M68_715250 [compost metagenome]
MTFSRYVLRLLWHWSFPFVLGAVLGLAGGAAQLVTVAQVIEDGLATTVQACLAAETGK